MAPGKRVEDREYAVRRHRLEDARCAQERGHGGRQGGGNDAGHDQRTPGGHGSHGPRVRGERPQRQVGSKQHGHRDVDNGRHCDGGEGAEWQAAAGVLEIARHRDALGEARYGREEDGKHRPETEIGSGRCPPVAKPVCFGPGYGAEIERTEGQHQENHDAELEPAGGVGAKPGKAEQCDDGNSSDGLRCPPGAEVDRARDRLSETDCVEGNRHRLGQEQDDPDSTAELDAERARDHVVIPPGPDLEVGRDRGKRKAGDHRHGSGNADDDQRVAQPGVAHDESEPQEEDDPEDREDRRHEHAGKSAESAAGLGGRGGHEGQST